MAEPLSKETEIASENGRCVLPVVLRGGIVVIKFEWTSNQKLYQSNERLKNHTGKQLTADNNRLREEIMDYKLLRKAIWQQTNWTAH